MFLGGDGWDSEDLLKGAAAGARGRVLHQPLRARRAVAELAGVREELPREVQPRALQPGGAGLRRRAPLYDAMSRATVSRPTRSKSARRDQGLPRRHRHHHHRQQPQRATSPSSSCRSRAEVHVQLDGRRRLGWERRMMGALWASARHGARAGRDDRARRARLHDGVRRAQAHQLRAQRSVHDGRVRRASFFMAALGGASQPARVGAFCGTLARHGRRRRRSASPWSASRTGRSADADGEGGRGGSRDHAARHRARCLGAPAEPRAAPLHRALPPLPAALRAHPDRHLRRRRAS